MLRMVSAAPYDVRMLFDAAVHEAGHAVVAVLLGFTVRDVKVWQDERGIFRGRALLIDFGGRTETAEPPPDGAAGAMLSYLEANPEAEECDALGAAFRQLLPGSRALNYLTMSAAGRVAQARVMPQAEAEARAGAGDDIASEQLVIDLALSDRERQGARFTATKIAEGIVDRHLNTILWVALELVARRRLDGAEVVAIVGKARMEGAAGR